MNIVPLNLLQPGQKGRVVKINLRGKLRFKLMDMGLINGAELEVLGLAPLGDPMEVKLKGFNLSLRKEDAMMIMVQPSPEKGCSNGK
jgi:Fe2+ transport system protein FeoA